MAKLQDRTFVNNLFLGSISLGFHSNIDELIFRVPSSCLLLISGDTWTKIIKHFQIYPSSLFNLVLDGHTWEIHPNPRNPSFPKPTETIVVLRSLGVLSSLKKIIREYRLNQGQKFAVRTIQLRQNHKNKPSTVLEQFDLFPPEGEPNLSRQVKQAFEPQW